MRCIRKAPKPHKQNQEMEFGFFRFDFLDRYDGWGDVNPSFEKTSMEIILTGVRSMLRMDYYKDIT